MLINVLGLQLDQWAALNLAVQFILPLLVGLVTTKETNREVQFFLLGLLTLLATIGSQVAQDHASGAAINVVQVVVAAIVNFLISILAHYNIWKPTNLSDLMLSLFAKNPAPAVTPAPTGTDPMDPVSAVLPASGAKHLAVVPDPAPVPAVAPVADPAPATMAG